MVSPANREEELFSIAIGFESIEERDHYLRIECGNNLELLNQVHQLLKYHLKLGDRSFLIDQPHRLTELQPSSVAFNEELGSSIGPYKLIGLIGEGGMGIVYLAEQTTPLRRRVALKIIKKGLDTHQVIARFEMERQILADLDHPNITKILDAGSTEGGRPYFVMELVDGTRLTEYCRTHRLTIAQRIALFGEVCQTIQHAHDKGIVHRDLKPSNILVTITDKRVTPKVIDFGIAKAIHNSNRLSESITKHEAELIGTPQYMSPEQAALESTSLDARSDVFSLGVVLYELLTGTTPIQAEQLTNRSYTEVKAIVRDQYFVPFKTCLVFKSRQLAELSEERQTTPEDLEILLRGDLESVLRKALENDRNSRYDNALELYRDLQRYLNREPVLAVSPSSVYYARKFITRHKLHLGVATLLLLFVLVNLTIVLFFYLRGRSAELNANQVVAGLESERFQTEIARQEVIERVRLQREEMIRLCWTDAVRIFGDRIKPHLTIEQLISTASEMQEEMLPREHDKSLPPYLKDTRKLLYFQEPSLIDLGIDPREQRYLYLFAFTWYIPDSEKESSDLSDEMVRDLGEVWFLLIKKFRRVLFEVNLERRREVFGTIDVAIADAIDMIAACDLEDGNAEKAEPLLRQSLDIRRRLLTSEKTNGAIPTVTSDNSGCIRTRILLGKCLLQTGRQSLAGEELIEARRELRSQSASSSDFYGIIGRLLVDCKESSIR